MKSRIYSKFSQFNDMPLSGWNDVHLCASKMPPDENAIQFQSNDYLSLCSNDEIKLAKINAVANNNSSAMMSVVFQQDDIQTQKLQQRFSTLTGYESALITQSGFAANMGVLQTLINPNPYFTKKPTHKTTVYIDQYAHMSAWEGLRGMPCRVIPFRHNSISDLGKKIQKYGAGIIFVDSIYSSNGNLCPLEEITGLSIQNQCVLIVDESHSLGIYGEHGSGMVNEIGLSSKVDFITASLSKAFSQRAGLVLGPKCFVPTFMALSSHLVFSSSILSEDIAAINATLNVIQKSSVQRKLLKEKSQYVRERLNPIYRDILKTKSHIISIPTGSVENTNFFKLMLESNGIYGSVFCPPASAINQCFIRFSISSKHSYEALNKLIFVIEKMNEIQLKAQNTITEN